MSDNNQQQKQKQYKCCASCYNIKPIASFHKDKNKKDGLNSWCRFCARLYTAMWRTDNREELLKKKREYYYNNHEDIVNKRKEQRKQPNRERLLETKRIQSRTYRQNNLEESRTRARGYYEKNKDTVRANNRTRRARRKNAEGVHTIEEMRVIYNEQKGLCYYCHQPVAWEARHDDHMIPLSRGGSNSVENMVVACPVCNLSKNAKTPEEFFLYLENKKSLE